MTAISACVVDARLRCVERRGLLRDRAVELVAECGERRRRARAACRCAPCRRVLGASSAGASHRNVCRAAAVASQAASASDCRRYAGETSRGVPQGSPRAAASATQSSGRDAGLNRPSAKRQRCSRESEQARKCKGWPGSSASTARQRSCSLARICCPAQLEELVVDRRAVLCRYALEAAHRDRASARSRRCRGSSRAARRAHRRRAASRARRVASGAASRREESSQKDDARFASHTRSPAEERRAVCDEACEKAPGADAPGAGYGASRR